MFSPLSGKELSSESVNLNLDTFSFLPTEIIFYILSFLKPAELCLICRLSKNFNLLANDNYLWLPFLLRDKTNYSGFFAKQLFKDYAFFVRDEYRRSSFFLRKCEAINALDEISRFYYAGAHHNEALTAFLKAQLEPKKKKFFRMDRAKFARNQQALENTFDVIRLIADFINNSFTPVWGSKIKGPTVRAAGYFYGQLQFIAERYGKKAVILNNPDCLKKAIDYFKMLDSPKKIIFSEIICHKRLVENENLSQLLDTLMKYLQAFDVKKYLSIEHILQAVLCENKQIRYRFNLR